jgi:hypothetical protein
VDGYDDAYCHEQFWRMISAYLHLDNHRRDLAQHLRLVMEVRITKVSLIKLD